MKKILEQLDMTVEATNAAHEALTNLIEKIAPAMGKELPSASSAEMAMKEPDSILESKVFEIRSSLRFLLERIEETAARIE